MEQRLTPMPSHGAVAARQQAAPKRASQPSSTVTARRANARPHASASAAYKADSSDYDDESDWDFGVGNLVIDLDADIEKSQNINNNNTPAKVSSKSTKMSSLEHQPTDYKQASLKMKIKRTKNVGAKSSEAKHEIVKSDGKSGAGNSLAMSDNSTGGNPTNCASEKGGKHNNTEKERSSAKGRGVHKNKVKDRNKSGGDQLSNGGPYIGAVPTNPTVVSTLSSSDITCTVTGNVSVDLGDRLSTSYNVKKDALPTHDPYEFNAKVEDRPLGFPHKKIKVEKVCIIPVHVHMYTPQTTPPLTPTASA